MAGQGSTSSPVKKTGLMGRLYHGETEFDIVGRRKLWYIASAVLLLICVGSMVFKGFNLGIEFVGGNQFTVAVPAGTTLDEAEQAVEDSGVEVATAQTAGSGDDAKYVIRTGPLSDADSQAAREKLATELGVASSDIGVSEVSSSWGSSVSRQALIALAVFLVILSGYLWLRFDRKMAAAALLALVHDILLTAGVYSIVGFEVTPGTVVGLLTILGYSLYDTVVVFDRVQENTKGLLGELRITYGEAANKALNETLMRSINTSIIGLLPVAGLLFVGVGVLGVGTLKDLALVLFVGMLTGAYSSMFLATPALVDFKLMEPRVKDHARKTLAKRKGSERKLEREEKEAAAKAAVAEPEPEAPSEGEHGDDDEDALAGSTRSVRPGTPPRPGARPERRKRKR